MPGPNILAMRVITTGQVVELRGSQIPEQIGNNQDPPLIFPSLGSSSQQGKRSAMNMVARQGGALFCLAGGNPYQVKRYDPDTDTWLVSGGINMGAVQDGGRTGKYGWVPVTGSNGVLYLVSYNVYNAGSVNNAQLNTVRVNPSGVVSNFIKPGVFNWTPQSENHYKPIVFSGQAWSLFANVDVDTFFSFDPVTGVQTGYAKPYNGTNGFQLFVLDDRLFMAVGAGSTFNTGELREFKFGVFQDTGLRFDMTLGGQNGGAYGTAFFHNQNGAVYLFNRGIGGATAGIRCNKFYVNTPGGDVQVSDVSDPVVPPSLRAGTATVSNSTRYGLWSFIDDQTDPTTPKPYLVFVPNVQSNTQATLFGFSKGGSSDPSVDDEVELEVVANMNTTSEYAYADSLFGSGAFLNGRETANSKLVTAQIVASAKGTKGVLLDYRVYGDPLVVPHDAVAGTFGPFEAGETIISSSGGSATVLETKPTTGEVRLFGVTGTFLNGDTLTQTTGTNAGANATQNAVSSGGLADKTVRFRYYRKGQRTTGTPATGICTLVPATNIGGTIVDLSGVGTGPWEVQDLIAEHLLGINPNNYQVEWDFLADGVPETSLSSIKVEVIRP